MFSVLAIVGRGWEYRGVDCEGGEGLCNEGGGEACWGVMTVGSACGGGSM